MKQIGAAQKKSFCTMQKLTAESAIPSSEEIFPFEVLKQTIQNGHVDVPTRRRVTVWSAFASYKRKRK